VIFSIEKNIDAYWCMNIIAPIADNMVIPSPATSRVIGWLTVGNSHKSMQTSNFEQR